MCAYFESVLMNQNKCTNTANCRIKTVNFAVGRLNFKESCDRSLKELDFWYSFWYFPKNGRSTPPVPMGGTALLKTKSLPDLEQTTQ